MPNSTTPPGSAPLVTVILPTYNAMPYLPEAVESILAQTYTNWKLIIVDDCSTDGSHAYLATLKDPRIQILRQPENTGPGAARNRGMDIAEGKYLAFLDADDIALPERLAMQVGHMENHPELDVLGTFTEHFGNSSGLGVAIVGTKNIARWIYFKGCFYHATCMYRRAFLERHNLRFPNLKKVEDFHFRMLCFEKGAIMDNLPVALVKYRVHAKSRTHSVSVMNEVQSFRHGFKSFFGKELDDRMILAYIKLYRYIPVENITYCDILRMYGYFFLHGPLYLKVYMTLKLGRYTLRRLCREPFYNPF